MLHCTMPALQVNFRQCEPEGSADYVSTAIHVRKEVLTFLRQVLMELVHAVAAKLEPEVKR